MKRILSSLVLALCTLVAPAQATPSLIVQNGILMGAQNVDVAGTLYNVSFVDGSCIAVFTTCESGSFDFTSSAMAMAATQALNLQVITDSALGNFRTTGLRMVYGCDMTGSTITLASACEFATPGSGSGSLGNVSLSVLAGYQNYLTSEATYVTGTSVGTISPSFSTVYDQATMISGDAVWVRWTRASSSVPLPGSALLLGLGLLGLSVRKTRASAIRT